MNIITEYRQKVSQSNLNIWRSSGNLLYGSFVFHWPLYSRIEGAAAWIHFVCDNKTIKIEFGNTSAAPIGKLFYYIIIPPFVVVATTDRRRRPEVYK